MATITPQTSTHMSIAVTMAAAAAGGDKVHPNALTLIRNADTTATTVTVVVPGTAYGIARPDYSFSVAAGEIASVGRFPTDLANADGTVDLTYSKVTALTIGSVAQ